MSYHLNILVLSKDPTLFSSGKATFGDTRKRHMVYAAALRERHPGSELRIICYAPKSGNFTVEKVSDGLRMYPTDSMRRATYLFGILGVLPSVLAGGWRPDVVTVQTPWEEGVLGYMIARLLNARYLPQLHFDLLSADWEKEHWLNPWRRIVASWLLRHADSIRVVSSVQREKLVGRLGIAPEKIRIVPVGVNFQPVTGTREFYKNNIAAGLATKKVVLFVGRFCRQKNLPLWVEVAEQVGSELPDAAFVMAGDGTLSAEVQALIRRKGLEGKFHLLGNVGHEQLPEIYAAADLFLLSSHYEGFGRVIVESYMAGVPVVSTACTGPEDIVDPAETGFLLPCGDLRGLADAVVQLLLDDEKRERFGRLGRERIMNSFSLETLTDKLVECWERA